MDSFSVILVLKIIIYEEVFARSSSALYDSSRRQACCVQKIAIIIKDRTETKLKTIKEAK